MSISCQRNLSQLQAECRKKGLTVRQSGPRESKTDYILALRKYYLDQRYPDGNIPFALDIMLKMDSPMLCKRYPELKPEQQEAIWSSREWFLEEKIDGNRMLYAFWKDLNGLSFDAYSRNISVEDYLPESYGDKIYYNIDSTKIVDDFMLDAEVVSTNPNISTVLGNKGVLTETQLQATSAILAINREQSIEIQKKDPLKFVTFDCIYYNGVYLFDKPLVERRKYLMKALTQLRAAGFLCELPASCYNGDRKAFYNNIIANRGEGCVAKRLTAPYIASNSRGVNWVKIKRTMTETMKNMGLSDSLDGWVSGFEPADETKGQAGLVGSLDISVTIRREDGTTYDHVIARVANLPLDLKKQMTEMGPDGKPRLKREYYGRVCSVNGQAVSARAKALKHAVFECWRPDLSMDKCIIDESFLLSQIM